MLNLKQTSMRLLLLSLLAVSLLGCSTQSKNIVVQPTVRIPNLPSSVKHTEPKLPTLAQDAKDTASVLEAYEKANRENKFAIEQAQKHNKGLQRTYNKPK